jgi:hypothetical protein
LVSIYEPQQINMWEHVSQQMEQERLQRTVMKIRSRYGKNAIQRGIMHMDKDLSGIGGKGNSHPHSIHPVGVFQGGMSVSWGGYTTTIAK